MASTPTSTEPLLSVLMITYNHEHFIRQAVESVLMQEVSFPLEIIISDDASTDRTPLLLEELSKNDSRIRLILRERNLTAVPNFYATLEECRGRYVALLEGDDYWTNPNKLQTQIDLLQANPDTVLCFHSCTVLNEMTHVQCDDKLLGLQTFSDPISFSEVVFHCPTASTVLKLSALQPIPNEYRSLYGADYPCFMLLSARGVVRYLPYHWSVRRLHPDGLWSRLQHGTGHNYASRSTVASVLGKEPHPNARMWRRHFLSEVKSRLHFDIVHLVDTGLWEDARPFVWRYLFGTPHPKFYPPSGSWALYLRLIFGFPTRKMLAKSAAKTEPHPRGHREVLKLFLKRLFQRIGLLVAKRSHPGARYLEHPPQSVFESVLLQRFPNLDNISFVQIGANDGKRFDPLYPFVKRHRWNGVLVEPMPQSFKALQKTYSGCSHLVLLQALVDEQRGVRTMHFVREGTPGPEWISGLATLNRAHLIKTLQPINIDESLVVSEELPAIAWDDVWKHLPSPKCDLLVLDTEGYDLVLLRAANLASRRPTIVHFEHQHFSTAERRNIYDELMDLGYDIATDENDTTAWLRANS